MATRFIRTTQSLTQDSGRAALLAWSVAVILLAAWLVWFVFGRVTLYEVSRQARLEVQQSAHPVAALVPSRIAANDLVVGQQVSAGELLIELDASSEKLKLAEEEVRLAAIAPRIASLRREAAALEQASARQRVAAVAAVEAAVFRTSEATAAGEFARDNERRLREESAVGGVAQVEAVRAHTEVLKLAANRDALAADGRRQELEAQAHALQQEAQAEALRRSVLSLEGDSAALQATVARLNGEIARYALRAPVSGMVAELATLRTGAYVAQGQRLVTIVPHGGFVVIADFAPAAVLGRIQPGQSAMLRLDGFPWPQYGGIAARVTRVAGELRDGLVRVEFAPELASARQFTLQHGLPGGVEVALEEVSPLQLLLRAAGRMHAAAPTTTAAPVEREITAP